MRRWLSEWLQALGAALRSPTARQKEAHARYCHTISAAGLIGGVTLLFSESALTMFSVVRATAMLVVAVVLFISGMLFNEEP